MELDGRRLLHIYFIKAGFEEKLILSACKKKIYD